MSRTGTETSSFLSKSKDYLRKMGSFSPNAKLFLIGIILLNVSGGIWGVIFNLYLLDVGFRKDFVGYMLSAGELAMGLGALPAGLICDRLKRRRSFLLAILSGTILNFVQIFTLDGPTLLVTSLLNGAVSNALYIVAWAPFIVEHSSPKERVYLFSMSSVLGWVSGMVGNIAGGILPEAFVTLLNTNTSDFLVSRMTLMCALAIQVAGLVPLYLVKEAIGNSSEQSKSFSFRKIRSRATIARLVFVTALMGLGSGFIVPLFNVFFESKLGASKAEIGTIFAFGQVGVAAGTLLMPALAEKLGKVKTVSLVELLSIPFILAIVLSPSLAWATMPYIVRGSLMNMVGPLRDSFSMEVVYSTERATTSGLNGMFWSILRAGGTAVAGGMMEGGDFFSPYLLTTVLYATSSILYLFFFSKTKPVDNPENK
ncbi:MAG: MFS transporter [Candidatus Bathyarchaeota archaeon]|nr:MAG: MFS transporter [Candidatus Bathyarchaeota archaeon]